MQYVTYSIEVSEEMKRDIDEVIVEDGFTGYDDFFTKLVEAEIERRRGFSVEDN